MRKRLGIIAAGLVVVVGVAWGQGNAKPSLQDQLLTKYKVVRMGADTDGTQVLEPGTVLDIQKGGILGFPYASLTVMPAKYQDGTLHPPVLAQSNAASSAGQKLCGLFGKCNDTKDKVTTHNTNHLFQVDDKVYPSKIAVNLNNDTIAFSIIACDSCNKTDPPTYFKAQVTFQFAKGYLATADAAKVEDTIAEVFSSDKGDDSKDDSDDKSDDSKDDSKGAKDQKAGKDQKAKSDGQQPAAAPVSIEKGQTIDQVVAAWGQPQKIVNLGAKQIYIYPDAKVLFLNGKVSDVQ